MNVTHFDWKADVDMKSRILKCSIEIHLEQKNATREKCVVLDCVDLRIISVHCDEGPLHFAVDAWKITILIPETSPFPHTLTIAYETMPKLGSLMWYENGGKCFAFTGGCTIGNRGLFPCQDAPKCLSTYTASVRVPNGVSCVMSAPPSAKSAQDSETTTYFFACTHKLATNTIGIAIGPFYKLELLPHAEKTGQYGQEELKKIPVAIYAPSWEVLVEAAVEFGPFENQADSNLEKIMCATTSILGPFPNLAEAIAIVFLPKNFSCLGLACPNLLFLSHSILCHLHNETKELSCTLESNESTETKKTILELANQVQIRRSQGLPVEVDYDMSLTRLAHELSHLWFGILLGASDWREEWLSEGFAVYLEDQTLKRAKVGRFSSCPSTADLDNFRDEWRRRSLEHECTNTSGTNQVLAPEPSNESLVLNALDKDKRFTQVHYMKGYFFLKCVETQTLGGGPEMLQIIYEFVTKYAEGAYITGQDFVDIVKQHITSKSQRDSLARAQTAWLHSSELLPSANNVVKKRTSNSSILKSVVLEFNDWVRINAALTSTKKSKLNNNNNNNNDFITKSGTWGNSEFVMLLSMLLHVQPKSTRKRTRANTPLALATVEKLDTTYHFSALRHNTDVVHLWCALLVRNRTASRYSEVRAFLERHRESMGIFLYGELFCEGLQETELAVEIYETLKGDFMDEDVRHTIGTMVTRAGD
eukprot:Phypoly_transcript_03794.p1 GENE.Phypoly_transcript_03794~~Phypoly_transcript_03794.p1  ORF type:complete len:705 (+),score=81.51 Phypoly_transcript_03794:151-2265(+)